MVAEPVQNEKKKMYGCSLAKISMVAEQTLEFVQMEYCCSLAKISMVAERLSLVLI